jgi:predicted AAA+ superfamily ATPase
VKRPKKKSRYPSVSASGFLYPFSQDDYLAIANHWARQLGVAEETIAACEREALNWALSRGSRSGRVAWQFAKDLAGRQKPKRKKNK